MVKVDVIAINEAKDREIVAGILVKNGYAVKLGKKKTGSGRTTRPVLEFWDPNAPVDVTEPILDPAITEMDSAEGE